MDDDWAIVIGINQYPKVVGASPLLGAVDDAKKFKQWLLKPEGGAVPQAHIGEFIQDASVSSGTLKPTESQLRYFRGSAAHLSAAAPVRAPAVPVLLRSRNFPTGRVHPQRRPADGKRHHADAFAAHPEYFAEGIRSSAYFKQVVLIMDCCRDFEKNVIPNHFDFLDPWITGNH
jgi:hypothetical protein